MDNNNNRMNKSNNNNNNNQANKSNNARMETGNANRNQTNKNARMETGSDSDRSGTSSNQAGGSKIDDPNESIYNLRTASDDKKGSGSQSGSDPSGQKKSR